MEQKKAHQVHNLIILDESGSMESIKNQIIQGFNELVQTIKGMGQQFPTEIHYISFVTFNGLGNKILHFIDPVSQLNAINHTNYMPNASTPLYDAIGFGVKKLQQVLSNSVNYNVLVTILTDGEENASKEYSKQRIKTLIETLKLQNWTFTYIGTNHDVAKFADSIAIQNHLAFEKDEEGIEKMFEQERSSRTRYSEAIRKRKYESTDEDNISYFAPK